MSNERRGQLDERGRRALPSSNMHWSPRHALAALLLGCACAATSSACSLALGLGEEQCQTSADCTKRGFSGGQCVDHVCLSGSTTSSTGSGPGGGGGAGGSDPQWACLPGFTTPTTTNMIPVEFQIVMATGGTLPSDLEVKLCSSFDATCSSPIDPNVTLDAAGKHTFMVAPTFGNGYLEIKSPSMGTYPTLAFFGTNVTIPPATKIIRLTTPTEFNGLIGLTKVTVDPTHGVAIILTTNCDDQRAAGIGVSTITGGDAKTIPFYFNGGLPDPKATQTDAEGAAGFVNLVPGIARVQTTRLSTGEYIGDVTFQVRASTISYVPLGPTTKL